MFSLENEQGGLWAFSFVLQSACLGHLHALQTFAIDCSISPTYSPVKVVRADGFQIRKASSMKQELLLYVLPPFLLLHLLLLPSMNMRKKRCMNSKQKQWNYYVSTSVNSQKPFSESMDEVKFNVGIFLIHISL